MWAVTTCLYLQPMWSFFFWYGQAHRRSPRPPAPSSVSTQIAWEGLHVVIELLLSFLINKNDSGSDSQLLSSDGLFQRHSSFFPLTFLKWYYFFIVQSIRVVLVHYFFLLKEAFIRLCKWILWIHSLFWKKPNCSYQRLHSKCIMNITQLQKFQFHLFSLLQFSLSQVNKWFINVRVI